MSRWTRALSVSVDDAALRVEAASSVVQTRIRAYTIVAASLVGLAVLVSVALELVALLARFALVSLGTQANGSMVRHPAQRVYTAR